MSLFRLFNPTLQTKTALYFILGLLGVSLSCVMIVRYFFIVAIDDLERSELTQASSQAHSVIVKMTQDLKERSYDWAYWDETYHLLQGADAAAFAERNLSQDGLDALSLDLMVFSDLKGSVVTSIVDEHNLQSAALAENIARHPQVRRHIKLMNSVLDAARTDHSGLLLLDDSIWNISLTPVRDSEGESSSTGWLIWGQNLSQRFPGDFNAILIADNRIIPLTDPTNHQPQFASREIEKDRNTMTEWINLVGLSGLPVATLSTTISRDYFNKGNVIFYYLLSALAAVSVVISVMTFLTFRRRVARRFSDLQRDIKALFEVYKLDGFDKPSKDELDRLSNLVQALATNTNKAEERLQDAQLKFDALYQSKSIAMLLVRERDIIDINQTALSMLEYQREQLLHKPLDLLCSPTDQPECQIDVMYRQFAKGETQFEAQMLTSQGVEIDCHIEVSRIKYQGKDAVMLSISDVREKKQQAKLIEDLVERDALSGLWNRNAIIEQFQELENKELSFIYFSIPNLNVIADVYGHEKYDESVKYVAALIKSKLTRFPVGRLSADEFIALVATHREFEEALWGAMRLHEELSEKQKVNGIEVDLRCNVSVVPPEISHYDFNQLLQAASYTVQNHKGEKGAVSIQRVNQEMFDRSQTAAAIKRDIAGAIHSGDIYPHYQPIVDSKTGHITGFEALARWQHPEFGFVSPAIFVPLAEQAELVIELGEQILRQACEFIQQVNQVQAKHGDTLLSVHVNLSAPHFYHSLLSAFLTDLIKRYQIGSGQLVIELTESILMGPESEVVALMDEIKAQGVLFALDDFGTGYSSFTTLCSYPLDIVKLDKSYIDQLANNDRAKSLVRHIANMAQELGLTTVAEGVETASQLRKLRNWNIEEIQGYYFYKPMPAEDIMALVRH
ncbi:EAL domain-containing protein [Vibrio sp. JPW-9-11-11]|uniref:bifunctional diguanylate cyclase/phosphodiesterase n=1 Tax=Vibrio sp. JPW-9-11-11 TaxID=1416532 RepID=UPI0015931873|nr:EAL domain-containing protein [Vibrio sp. JPW-9-11-11]NVD06583.1 EAL domain-containing protein [Vibrio sp. JPW-9-11-11]